MKKHEITTEQIIAISKGEIKINDLFPEVFEVPDFVGKWVGYKTYKDVLVFADGKIRYGIDFKGDWFVITEDFVPYPSGCFVKPDPEVLQALTDYAVKLGIVKGAVVQSAINEDCKTKILSEPSFKLIGGELEMFAKMQISFGTFESQITVLNSQGQWAKVIPQVLTLEQRVEKLEADYNTINELLKDK